jgi:hypothetical protein
MGLDLEKSSAPDHGQCAGAPIDEIEITPEMIEAGVRAFYAADQRIGSMENVVESIFEAMWAARDMGKTPFPEVAAV